MGRISGTGRVVAGSVVASPWSRPSSQPPAPAATATATIAAASRHDGWRHSEFQGTARTLQLAANPLRERGVPLRGATAGERHRHGLALAGEVAQLLRA